MPVVQAAPEVTDCVSAPTGRDPGIGMTSPGAPPSVQPRTLLEA